MSLELSSLINIVEFIELRIAHISHVFHPLSYLILTSDQAVDLMVSSQFIVRQLF